MDEVVEKLVSQNVTLWDEALREVEQYDRYEQTQLWHSMLKRLANNPPPIQGEVSQDQWFTICQAHYRELF